MTRNFAELRLSSYYQQFGTVMTQRTHRSTARFQRFIATPTLVFTLLALSLAGCAKAAEQRAPQQSQSTQAADYSATLVVAGGCFWCVESDLEKLPGVGDVVSGYAGGATQNPTYRNHSAHLEVVRAPYDPAQISYAEIVNYFLRHIDPLDVGGQFCDRGHSYTTAIFYSSDEERSLAETAVAQAEAELGQKIVTPVIALDKFWIAEDYHQNYYSENPVRYNYYRRGCGRDARVAEVWGEAK